MMFTVLLIGLYVVNIISNCHFLHFTLACEESYNKSEELDACTLGCKSQVPHVVDNQQQVIQYVIIQQ